MNTLERDLLHGSLGLYSKSGLPAANFIDGAIDFEAAPFSSIQLVGGTFKRILAKPVTFDWCITGGASLAVARGALNGVSGGVFFSSDPFVGLYGSFDVGLISNVGASGVGQVGFYSKSARTLFNGRRVVLVGFNVSIGGFLPPVQLTGGAFGAFQFLGPIPGTSVLSPKSWDWIGIGFNFGIAAGKFPFDIYILSSLSVTTIP